VKGFAGYLRGGLRSDVAAHPLVSEVAAAAMAILALVLRSRANAAKAWRWGRSGLLRRLSANLLRKLQPSQDVPATLGRSGKMITLTHTLFAAPPEGETRGLLCISNEDDLRHLLGARNLSRFAERYDVYVGSAWSPIAPELYLDAAIRLGSPPLWVGISNESDLAHIVTLKPHIATVPLLVSEWLNPADFTPTPKTQRDIDILMVANWGAYKRHWVLFKALRALPRSLHVTLVGGPNGGRTLRNMQQEARVFGVAQKIEWLESIPAEAVHRLQSRARVVVQTSRREGSCVAVAEALMADTPVVITADSHIGSMQFINGATGEIGSRTRLGRVIGSVLDRHADLHPREWMIANASYHSSLPRLQQTLGERHNSVQEIPPFFWRYFMFHSLHPSQSLAMQDAVDELSKSFGLLVEPS